MSNYAIVGGGRLARHFSHYFQYLDIPHTRWTRDHRSSFNSFDLCDAELRLKAAVADTSHVLLLVSDSAIASVLKQYPFLHEKKMIHCSGALSFAGVAGAHPLMTFTDRLYNIDTYQSIPFVLEAGYSFSDWLPGLPNPHFSIDVEDKARYHALCVMAGNFSQIVWKAISDRFEQQLELPAKLLHPYLDQVAANFMHAPESALTGPFARNDRLTIERNIHSLAGDSLQDLYRAYDRFYKADTQSNSVLGPARMEQIR